MFSCGIDIFTMQSRYFFFTRIQQTILIKFNSFLFSVLNITIITEGTELKLNEECLYPEKCDDNFCCCACSTGTYNADPLKYDKCLPCPNKTVSGLHAETCSNSCSYGKKLL